MNRKVLVALVFFGVACSGESLDQQDYDDLAEMTNQMLNNESGGEVESLRIVTTVSVEGDLPRGFSGTIEDFENTVLGVQYNYSVKCQPACGPGATRADVEVGWSGSLETIRVQADLERSGAWKVTGLDTGTPTFDGDGSFDVETTFTPLLLDRESHFRASFDASYDGLQVDPVSLLPVTGRISFRLQAERLAEAGDDKVEAEFDVTAELEVKASGTATLTIDGAYVYDLDLDSGSLEPSEG